MYHNMSIYRRLNPRLLVKQDWAWTYYIGLICLIYISNTLPQTQGGSSMKAWGLISMRRSFGDALKNASKDEKCEPIDRFQSFKWRNRVQDQNLHKKLSKIGHFGNFDFWSKVNAISQNQWLAWSMVYTTRVGSRLFGSGHRSGYKAAEIMMYQWHGLRLTWQDDFIGWC